MSAVFHDLWPADLVAEDVLSPQEILEEQAEQLTRRMNDLLQGRVTRFEGEGRVILGFEVIAPRIDLTKRLFSVQHQTDAEYPALVVPPDDDLPGYLKGKSDVPAGSPFAVAMAKGEAIQRAMKPLFPPPIDMEWVATTPKEFTDRLARVLASSSVKSAIVSLLAKSQRSAAKSNPPDDHT